MAIEYLSNKSCHGQAAHLSDYIERKTNHHENDDFLCSGHGNLPSWATSTHDFFATADRAQKMNEKKPKNELKIKDEIGKHIIIALPKEFDGEELQILAKETAEKICENHAYVYGVHINHGSLSNERNPHLHILICDRKIEPDRAEPDRDTYFKKSRTLKNGEISGGFRKDNDMTGKDRRKWTENIKKEYQKICNRHIENHNEKTGENVAKIDFEKRKGKGEKHIGKNAIAVALKKRSKIVQNELDLRIKKITDETEKSVKEKLDKNGGKLDLWDKGEILITRIFKGKNKAQEKKENLQIVFAKNPDDLGKEIADLRAVGGERATATADGLNEGLKQTAEHRKIERKITYRPTATADLKKELNEKAQAEQRKRAEEEERRRIREELIKAKEEEKQRREEERRKAQEWAKKLEEYRKEEAEEERKFKAEMRRIEREEENFNRKKRERIFENSEPEQPKIEPKTKPIAPMRATARIPEQKKIEKKRDKGFER